MDESMGSARALRTTSLLVAVTGVALMCVGIVMIARADSVTRLFGADDARDLLRAIGVVAICLGGTALVVAVIMRRLSRRIMREAVALRKLARHMAAGAASDQAKPPEVPTWALRTPPVPHAGRDERPHDPQLTRSAADGEFRPDDESPAERTDTWAAIDAMRADERDRRRKSA